jgi:hypothetical protein
MHKDDPVSLENVTTIRIALVVLLLPAAGMTLAMLWYEAPNFITLVRGVALEMLLQRAWSLLMLPTWLYVAIALMPWVKSSELWRFRVLQEGTARYFSRRS